MTNRSLHELLMSSVQQWNTWRLEHPETLIDLSHADLRGANLSGADLQGDSKVRAPRPKPPRDGKKSGVFGEGIQVERLIDIETKKGDGFLR
jgi:hypothetical protein